MWSAKIDQHVHLPYIIYNNNIMQSVTDLRANNRYVSYITALDEILSLSLPHFRLSVTLVVYRSPREYFGLEVEDNAAVGSPSSPYTHYT